MLRVEETTEVVPVRSCREYRKGIKYNTMRVSPVVLHKFDSSRLLKAAEIILSFVKML